MSLPKPSRTPPRVPTANWRPALKSVPSLHLPHSSLVDYLSNGYGYDNESVTALVREGNRLFAGRQLEEAAKAYGATYEIARLHYVYPPLMHDLVLRRVLCLLMLGDDGNLKRAQFEAELALQILPHAPTTYLICGIIYSKQHRTDDANHAFQHAVEQCRLLRDIVECIVALFKQARGHCDHAIEICTEVLRRSPRCPAALLTRGMAYKHHASGYLGKQADADFAELLKQDPAAAPFINERFVLLTTDYSKSYGGALIEDLLLHFHPSLSAEGPRAYEEYPAYSQRQPLLTVCLVCFAVAKFRTLVRSARLVRNVCKKHEELVQQRAAAERRMQELVEAQRNFAHLEQRAEVWGPADPDNASVRKYRRYWMERPSNFPQRENVPQNRPLTIEKSIAVQGRTAVEAPPLPRSLLQEVNPSLSAAASEPPASPMPFARPGISGMMETPSPPLGPPAAPKAPAPSKPPGVHVGGSPLGPQGLPMGVPPSGPPMAPSSGPPPPSGVVPPPSMVSPRVPMTPPVVAPPPPGAPQFRSPQVAPPAPPGMPPPQAANGMASLQPSVMLGGNAEPPPISKIGSGWTQRQWFLKAMELADAFSNNQKPPSLFTTPSGNELELPNYHPNRVHMPPLDANLSKCKMVRSGGDADENIIEVVEREGFDAIPDWYSALDHIFAITDMACVSEKPEPFVGDASLAGAKGFSYLVPRNPPKSPPRSSSKERVAEANSNEMQQTPVFPESVIYG